MLREQLQRLNAWDRRALLTNGSNFLSLSIVLTISYTVPTSLYMPPYPCPCPQPMPLLAPPHTPLTLKAFSSSLHSHCHPYGLACTCWGHIDDTHDLTRREERRGHTGMQHQTVLTVRRFNEKPSRLLPWRRCPAPRSEWDGCGPPWRPLSRCCPWRCSWHILGSNQLHGFR